jgi:hypothetical protein
VEKRGERPRSSATRQMLDRREKRSLSTVVSSLYHRLSVLVVYNFSIVLHELSRQLLLQTPENTAPLYKQSTEPSIDDLEGATVDGCLNY